MNKVCDLGLVDESSRKMDGIAGTLRYLPPESVHGPGVDLWALGIMVYKMLEGDFPFPIYNKNPRMYASMLRETGRTNPVVSLKGPFSHAAQVFVASLLSFNPETRLKPEQLHTHPFLLEVITVHVPCSPLCRDCFNSLWTIPIEVESISNMLETRAHYKDKVVSWGSVAKYAYGVFRAHVSKSTGVTTDSITKYLSEDAFQSAKIYAYSASRGTGHVVSQRSIVESGSWEAVVYFAPQMLNEIDPSTVPCEAPKVANMRRGEELYFKARNAKSPQSAVLNMQEAARAYLEELEKCSKELDSVSGACARVHSVIKGVEAVCATTMQCNVADALRDAHSAAARAAALKDPAQVPSFHVPEPLPSVEPFREYEDRKRPHMDKFCEIKNALAKMLIETLAEGSARKYVSDSAAARAAADEMMGLCDRVKEAMGLYEYVYAIGTSTYLMYWDALSAAIESLDTILEVIVPAVEAIKDAGKTVVEDTDTVLRRVDEYNVAVIVNFVARPTWVVRQYVPSAEKRQPTIEEMRKHIESLEFECRELRGKNEALRKKLNSYDLN